MLKDVITNTGSEGCDGVNKYYTGNGFREDVRVYMDDYWESRKSIGDVYTERGFEILPISDMGREDYDCEDVSRGIYCISEQYDVECDFYYQKNYGRRDVNVAHVGVQCLVAERWIDMS